MGEVLTSETVGKILPEYTAQFTRKQNILFVALQFFGKLPVVGGWC
jgi:hypothetical protein